MKFARYLEETQTPEWKKAYIDYRGLKKQITAIRHSRQAVLLSKSSEGLVHSPVPDSSSRLDGASASGVPRRSVETTSTNPSDGHSTDRPITLQEPPLNEDETQSIRGDSANTPSRAIPLSQSANADSSHLRHGRSNTVTTMIGRAFQRANSIRGTASGPYNGSSRFDLRRPIPLLELLPELTPIECAFFEKLDAELDKVESFYCERERDMRHRANLLKEQLQELKDHRRAFYDAYPITAVPYSWLPLPLPFPPPVMPTILVRRRKPMRPAITPRASIYTIHSNTTHLPPPQKAARSWRHTLSRRSSREDMNINGRGNVHESLRPTIPKARVKSGQSTDRDETAEGNDMADSIPSTDTQRRTRKNMAKSMQALFPFRAVSHKGDACGNEDCNADNEREEGEGSEKSEPASPKSVDEGRQGPKYDPEEYQHAKKQLKKAVLECYRGLEVLNNYRTLNLIGFRKALKKFEKVTNIPAQMAYTKEKIEPSAFSSGATVDTLIHDMEALFAARFARGDKKKAMARLRGGSKHTSHHFSTFRTGMSLGLAVPALADGLYQSFRQETRAGIPGWDGLMYVYAVFFIPTFFALLVGVNLLVWARARINYVFIFELDLRTKLDHRVYFEMPAFLLSLLCYAFWLSFSRIGEQNISPTTWPLLWLAFAVLIMVDPLPIMFKPSRWWLIRNVSKLLTSGMHRVEFADFWMGDQFCSLVFTLSNLYYVACVYANGIDPDWRQCTARAGPQWGITFLLASLPLLVRLVQSIKRWVDSGLITHLINGGKYGSGIVYYLFYYLWRAQGGTHGPMFVAWCVFATLYSLYAGAWDLLMDWSLLRPHAPHPLLRPELLYTNNIPFYYFAIISNILIRFIWVLYIPTKGPNFIIRTFIASVLEILRRWQWNFLRLENEHLGNIDQYRVTREVPLPYSYDDPSHESDGDDDEDRHTHQSAPNRSWKRGRKAPESDETAAEIGPVDN